MGESACWLHQVCWVCGDLVADLADDGRCAACAAEPGDTAATGEPAETGTPES